MRRVLAPLGGAISFACVVFLVIGGLAWVTVEALHIENERAIAKAHADAAQQERLALWQLDSRLFPAWGVENNRAYAHYFAFYTPYPVVVNNAWGNAEQKMASPLLTTELPDWMTLHFQLDPVRGWESPQVMGNEGEVKLRIQLKAVCDLTPELLYTHRCTALAELREKFPVKASHDQLMRHESLNPDDSYLAVPFQYDQKFSANPVSAPNPASARSRDIPAPVQPPMVPLPPLPKTDADTARKAAAPTGRGADPEPAAPAQEAQPQAPVPTVDSRDAANGNRGRANPPPANEPAGGYKSREGVAKATQDDFRGTQNNSALAVSPGFAGNDLGAVAAAPKVEQARKETGAGPSPAAPKIAAAILAPRAGKPAAALPEDDGKLSPKPGDGGVRFASPEPVKDKTPDRDEKKAEAKKLVVPVEKPPTVQVGPMRSVWLKDSNGREVLVLVRAARLENKTVFQGVLLDWPKLQAVLLGEILGQLPQAKLTPVRDNTTPNERLMTALPAVLEPGPEPAPPPLGWTPLRIGLTLSWVAALLALAAVGFVGWTLIDLSERRIRFVSAVTHELRTPLTALRLYTDLLSSGMISEEEKQKEYLRTLGHESERLNTLIENVLDFAKVERGKAAYEFSVGNLGEVVARAVEVHRHRSDREGIEVGVAIPERLPPALIDPRAIELAILNLLDNAFKYAKDGGRVDVDIESRGRALEVRVSDRGPGIPPEEHDQIFERFVRGRGATEKRIRGSGIGLSLVKHIAESHGGTIRVESPATPGGRGSAFILTIPAAPTVAAPTTTSAADPGEVKKPAPAQSL